MTTSDPKTAYVIIYLKATKHAKPIRIKALHDSGCAKTIMSQKVFEEICQQDQVILHQLPNVAIASCTGERTQPTGYVSIYMEFQDEQGRTATFPHDILVHETLDHDLLLGRDFTGSQHKILETNEHIHLQTEDKFTKLRNEIRIPIHNEYQKITQVLAVEAPVTIPPHTLAVIPCKIVLGGRKQANLTTIVETFEILKMAVPSLEHISALYTFEEGGRTNVTVCNTSEEQLDLNIGAKIANIQLNHDILRVYHMDMTQQTSQQGQALTCAHVKLEEDEGLNEEEKENLFLEYLESGQYTPSMTGYIENAPSVTEMSYKNTKGWSDDDFDGQFDLNHLNPTDREQTLQVLWNHKQIFSRHEMDIGLAPNIEMEIEVDRERG